MSSKNEKQLNFLLPISGNRKGGADLKISKSTVSAIVDTEKRYVQIKESLKNKGLLKSR